MKRITVAILTCAFVAATLATTTSPASASTQMTFSSIAAGYDHTCALTNSGAAYCWGGDAYGQLGNGTTSASPSLTPVAVTGGHTFTAIAAAGYFTCAIDNSQAAYCWGENNSGQLGDGSYATQSSPVAVGGSHSFTSISISDQATACAITTAHDSYCWGNNYYGGFGDGTQNSTSIPQLTLGSHQWASISADEQGTCAVTTTNVGYCWGTGAIGHLGVGDASDHFTPTLVTGGHNWLKITTNVGSSCGLDISGAAWCWGGNGPALGDAGVNFNSNDPVAVAGGHTFTNISGGASATCATTSSGTTYCWGDNTTGAVGDGTTQDRNVPTLVAGSHSFTQLSASYHFACGLTSVGIAYCWGNNADGELGDGTSTERDSPASTYYIESDQTVAAIVDPSFTFTVAPDATTCNGATPTSGTSSSSTAVALGHITSAASAIAAQNLTITTNAGNGSAIYMRDTGALRNAGHSIADVSSDSPFPATGTEGFGYQADWMNPTHWNPVSTSNSQVFTDSSSPAYHCIAYQAQVSSTTPAGAYSTLVIYTAVPSF